MGDDPRRAELAANLAVVEDRIAAACRASDRARSEITLIAVTKTFPAADVRRLADLGVLDVAENRDQEAAAKVDECARLGLGHLRWHFVGQVQTNKARSIASYAHLVHSVDRERLVTALDRGAAAAARQLPCLAQVDLGVQHRNGGDRGGAGLDEVAGVAAHLDAAENLLLAGVMAVAPRQSDSHEAFSRLATVAGELRRTYPDAVVVSAGMSGDLEAAVRNGATHLRVGSALLGWRPPLG